MKKLLLCLLTALFCFSPAQAVVIVYTGILSGAAESPPVVSAGTGTVTVTYDNVARTLRVQTNFSGLTGNTTAAHIHAATAVPGAGTAGVATTTPSFVGFPTGVTAGSMDQTYDLTVAGSYNAAFITANGGTTALAETALANALAGGRAYFNIHTSFAPGGEVRSFLTVPAGAPEVDASSSLVPATLVALMLVGSRRRRWVAPN
ncbi:MAG: CHRD domain-containing protein [Vulcanimicrobiota bacterium]